MEDSVSVSLGHFGVNVETRVAQLSDFFGQELYSVDRVTEDDALVDLELGE